MNQLLAGNFPDFLRTPVPVTMLVARDDGTALEATIWVLPDYLAIGGDDDYLYFPLSRPSASKVARAWGFVLPTCKMVDAVYAQAVFHFTPVPMTPGPQMRSSTCYLEHQRRVDEQYAGERSAALVAGHKKDIVLTNRLGDEDDRIAIYGWHRSDDDPIQPLSTWHGAHYADYSHGARLVWDQVSIEGCLRSIVDVLADPDLAPVLTYDGSFPDAAELLRWDDDLRDD